MLIIQVNIHLVEDTEFETNGEENVDSEEKITEKSKDKRKKSQKRMSILHEANNSHRGKSCHLTGM